MKKLIDNYCNDIIIIDNDGEVVFDDLGNYNYFQLGKERISGKNIKTVFPGIDEEYPLLKSAKQGVAVRNFDINVKTARGISLNKTGSSYPLYDGDVVKGAIEFAQFYYDKNHIAEIEQHSEHLFYRQNNTKYLLEDIITQDEKMKAIKKNIVQIALADAAVLIYGETGTGKELIAQSIHNASRRFKKKFVSINCSAIPEQLLEGLLFGTTQGSFTGAVNRAGLFESVEGGTVFLDEVNSLQPDLQVKLLKVIESGRVRRIGSEDERRLDFRVIAATNENPYLLLKTGKIKPDFFYRLAVIYLEVPPLRERKNDLRLLVEYFITYFNAKTNSNIVFPTEDIIKMFEDYSWPGNVRELRNVIEGAFSFAEGNEIEKTNIPCYILNSTRNRKKDKRAANLQETSMPAGNILENKINLEKKIISEALADNEHSLTITAKLLGISKQLLKYKMNKYGV